MWHVRKEHIKSGHSVTLPASAVHRIQLQRTWHPHRPMTVLTRVLLTLASNFAPQTLIAFSAHQAKVTRASVSPSIAKMKTKSACTCVKTFVRTEAAARCLLTAPTRLAVSARPTFMERDANESQTLSTLPEESVLQSYLSSSWSCLYG